MPAAGRPPRWQRGRAERRPARTRRGRRGPGICRRELRAAGSARGRSPGSRRARSCCAGRPCSVAPPILGAAPPPVNEPRADADPAGARPLSAPARRGGAAAATARRPPRSATRALAGRLRARPSARSAAELASSPIPGRSARRPPAPSRPPRRGSCVPARRSGGRRSRPIARPGAARSGGAELVSSSREEERSPRQRAGADRRRRDRGGGGARRRAALAGGGSTPSACTGRTPRALRSGGRSGTTGGAAVANPAETHVVVLNDTETSGLAHRVAANLQQSGYTQAAAQGAAPAECPLESVVEYAPGHRVDAQHVAQTLGMSALQPLEARGRPARRRGHGGGDRGPRPGNSCCAPASSSPGEGSRARAKPRAAGLGAKAPAKHRPVSDGRLRRPPG